MGVDTVLLGRDTMHSPGTALLKERNSKVVTVPLAAPPAMSRAAPVGDLPADTNASASGSRLVWEMVLTVQSAVPAKPVNCGL